MKWKTVMCLNDIKEEKRTEILTDEVLKQMEEVSEEGGNPMATAVLAAVTIICAFIVLATLIYMGISTGELP